MIYYGYRFYNPNLGRWINRDPIAEAGGINLYGFVLNDPVNFIDPTGLEFYGAANAGFAGFNYSASTQNPSQATVTTGDGVLGGGSLSVGYDFGRGIFDDTFHDIVKDTTVNIGLGKYLGVSFAPDLSKIQLNIGLGLALPASLTVPISDQDYNPIDFTFGDEFYDILYDSPCN